MDISKRIKSAAKDFETLTEQDCIEVTLAAKSLSLQECYDLLLIHPDDLSNEEIKFFSMLHNYGRSVGIKDATEALFSQMKYKGGDNASLEYLRKMGGEFSVVATPGKSGFSFNVDIGEK